jgi:enoyl-CoA hydratase/carnithine racemase
MFVERAPGSVAWAKRVVREISVGAPAPTTEEDAEAAIRCFETADFHEAVRAFQEKRKPHFTGQ